MTLPRNFRIQNNAPVRLEQQQPFVAPHPPRDGLPPSGVAQVRRSAMGQRQSEIASNSISRTLSRAAKAALAPSPPPPNEASKARRFQVSSTPTHNTSTASMIRPMSPPPTSQPIPPSQAPYTSPRPETWPQLEATRVAASAAMGASILDDPFFVQGRYLAEETHRTRRSGPFPEASGHTVDEAFTATAHLLWKILRWPVLTIYAVAEAIVIIFVGIVRAVGNALGAAMMGKR